MPVHERGAQRASSHRTRPVKLAMLGLAAAFALGSLAVTPAPALPFAIFATTALIIASPFAARAILRRKGSRTGRDVRQDQAILW